MRPLRICLLVVLSLPAILHGQTNAVGTWKAVFVGPMGPRPQMVDDVIFSIEARGNGFTGTAKTEPEWPGVLTVSDVKLAGDKFSFIGIGKDGWTSNGQYHCCPRLAFAGTIKGDEMTLTMTWTSTERPDDPTATPLPMEAKRIKTDFSGTWTLVPQSPPPSGQAFQRLWIGDPVTITQDATTITIEYVSGSRAHMPVTLVYNLDGSERTNIDRNSLPESQARRSRAAWRGAELVLTTTTPRLDATGALDPVEATEALSPTVRFFTAAAMIFSTPVPFASSTRRGSVVAPLQNDTSHRAALYNAGARSRERRECSAKVNILRRVAANREPRLTRKQTMSHATDPIVYWHRELPPLDAELVAEHTIEATSSRVAGTLSHRDELWDRCYQELMSSVHARLIQEIARLGGHYAHVHDESIDTRHDEATGEAWLHGCFS